MEYNNAGEGIHAIAQALQSHKTLTSLNLTANQVRCADSTARGLKENIREQHHYLMLDMLGGVSCALRYSPLVWR